MSPQIEFGLELSFRRPDLYSTAKLRCTFFNLRSLGVSVIFQRRLQHRNKPANNHYRAGCVHNGLRISHAVALQPERPDAQVQHDITGPTGSTQIVEAISAGVDGGYAAGFPGDAAHLRDKAVDLTEGISF